MSWILFLAALLVLLIVPLALPLQVEIDTAKGVYQANWQGIFRIRGVPAGEGWRWFYRVFFFETEWRPGSAEAKPPRKKPRPKRKAAFSMRQAWALAKNLYRAIEVKRFYLHWDTDDFALNAQLYPLFRGLSRGSRQLAIHFDGHQELSILLQTRPCLLVWAFLRVFILHKINKP